MTGLTQFQLKQREMAMKGMDHDDMAMNNEMMAGTHDMILDVTDAFLGKEIANASAKVLIVSPSKKNSSVDLKPMKGLFGGPLTLDEKGEYQCTVSVDANGVSKTKQFHYKVK
jgi:hypothetical protein